LKTIAKACNAHYLPIFRQQFDTYARFRGEEIDEYTADCLTDEYYEKYKDFTPGQNQFIVRVGRFSQARAVTIEGKRSGDQETTTWLFGCSNQKSQEASLIPFGWILCEVVT